MKPYLAGIIFLIAIMVFMVGCAAPKDAGEFPLPGDFKNTCFSLGIGYSTDDHVTITETTYKYSVHGYFTSDCTGSFNSLVEVDGTYSTVLNSGNEHVLKFTYDSTTKYIFISKSADELIQSETYDSYDEAASQINTAWWVNSACYINKYCVFTEI